MRAQLFSSCLHYAGVAAINHRTRRPKRRHPYRNLITLRPGAAVTNSDSGEIKVKTSDGNHPRSLEKSPRAAADHPGGNTLSIKSITS